MISILYSDQFLDHQTGAYHPESPGRLTAITKALHAAPWAEQLDWRSPTPIAQQGDRLMAAIQDVHPSRYVEAVQEIANAGGGHIDPDTPLSAASYGVALLAVSAWLDGVDRVIATGEPVFALTRPPGHHALPMKGMGFCIFSNAAIAAHYALKQPGIERVAILDWDVHHGNGTQAVVEKNPQIIFCSLHEFPQYPGTGTADERGKFNNVLNFPMHSGSTLADYQPLFEAKILPFLQQFQPDLLIVSAGYDANHADPLASISLRPEDYGVLTHYCLQATRCVLFGLEGGYDLTALAQSVVATVAATLKPS
jgi:acetoin utilization deacetylase AcuC-like enzyme